MEWRRPFWLVDSLPTGPRRIVLNIAYQWADMLFASYLHPKGMACPFHPLPSTVSELVVHFRRVGSPRPRLLRCVRSEILPGHFRNEVIDSLCGDAIPILLEEEHLELVSVPQPRTSLFDQLAEVYVANPGLTLTLVGLEEFDAARDADADGDEAFAELVPSLPWMGEVPLPSTYARPAYEPVAPSFVAHVAGLLPKEREVRPRVHIISAAAYLPPMGVRKTREEDWWSHTVEGVAYDLKARVKGARRSPRRGGG